MFEKFVIPLTTLSAVVVLILIVTPTGASERRGSNSMYVFGRDAVIDLPVHGDLLVLGGSVTFTGEGRVDGDVIHAGSRIANAEHRVRGKIVPLASLEGAAASMAKNAVVASLLLVWLIVAVIVTLMSGREIRLASIEVRSSALHCFVLGLVATTSFVLTAIAFSYLVPYVVGIPLLAGLGVFAVLTKVFGMIAFFHAAGTLIAGSRTRRQLASRTWLRGDLAMVVIGALLLGAIRLIPVVGTIVWGLASIFAVGTALATRFGRREPWFLAFRTVNA